MVTRFDRLDLEELYNLVMQRFETTTPEGIDLILWGDLRTMFDANAQDELWQNQEGWKRKCPLIKETLKRMLSLMLVAGTASEDAYTLLRFIQKQIDEYGSHDEELASPKQTALGKDFLNPLIVDSLLKTIWLSMHHVIKHWLFQSKRLLDEDIHDLRSVETEFLAVAFNDGVSSKKTLSCEPTVSSLNNEIAFRVSFDDSDDEDYTVIFDKNSFSYKIISINDLKTDSKNDNEKVNMPSFPPPEPTVSCFDDLDFFKDFENEFPAIVYNNAQTSKSDILTEPILNPQHIDEFNLKDETSLSECDEEEQNVLNFNDLFHFNVIYHNDSKSDKDNDDDKVDIEHS
ncbi:hypothetical protein Tco_0970497 [Tanacetum coccineum]